MTVPVAIRDGRICPTVLAEPRHMWPLEFVGHQWVRVATTHERDGTAMVHVRCTRCGERATYPIAPVVR